MGEKVGRGREGQLADNTKLRPRNREHLKDAESNRQPKSGWQQHTNQTCISLGVFKELHLEEPVSYYQNETRGPRSGTNRVTSGQGSATLQEYNPSATQLLFWQGVKCFMGEAGGGPCAASADL